jgi:hypothetical protein
MKTRLLALALTLLLFSCKQETKTETSKNFDEIFNSKELLGMRKNISDPVEKFKFYQHLYLVTVFEGLKNYPNEEINTENIDKGLLELKKYPDNVLIDISKIVVSEYTPKINKTMLDSPYAMSSYTPKEVNNHLDSIFSTEKYNLNLVMQETIVCPIIIGGTYASSFQNNIVTIERSFGTGSSLGYQYALIKDNKVTNLGQVFDYLDKSVYQNLVSEIKKTDKNFLEPSGRSRTEINPTKNKTYLISFQGYSDEDAGCCPSLSISYETNDFKNIIPNSIKVK